MKKLAIAAFLVLTLAPSVGANPYNLALCSANTAVSYDSEACKVATLSAAIAGIFSAMTSVAILPMGISSAMRAYRHIVLNNI